MVYDLRTILDGWDYEPGKISVRKIIGRDGREKVQTRVDLGVIQCETTGRPDGTRPHGCESLLDYHEQRLDEHIARHGTDDGFVLSPQDCQELRREANLYYQRYIALFVLGEFEAVARDTEHNLRIIDLCHDYAAEPDDREALEGQRAYVVMMYTRAQVYQALDERQFEQAITRVEEGIEQVREILAELEGYDHEPAPELNVLNQLREEVLNRMPPDARPRLEWELEQALAAEDYERAAELRDKLGKPRRNRRRSVS